MDTRGFSLQIKHVFLQLGVERKRREVYMYRSLTAQGQVSKGHLLRGWVMLAELKSWTHSSSSQWDAPPSSLVFDSSGVRWLLRGDHQSGCVLSKCNLIAQNPVFEMWSETASPTLALVWAPLLGSPCSDWVKDFPNADLVTPKLSLEALLPCFPMAFVVWKCTS